MHHFYARLHATKRPQVDYRKATNSTETPTTNIVFVTQNVLRQVKSVYEATSQPPVFKLSAPRQRPPPQRLQAFSFPLAPLSNKVALGAAPNNLWTRVGAEKKTEHVTVIKCVLLPAVWQAPKYNSERIADRRPDGIGSRYLSEINRMRFVSQRETTEATPNDFDPLQRDFTCMRVF